MFESNLFGFPTKSLSEYTVKGPIRLNVEMHYLHIISKNRINFQEFCIQLVKCIFYFNLLKCSYYSYLFTILHAYTLNCNRIHDHKIADHFIKVRKKKS